jgi:hypothetical protein
MKEQFIQRFSQEDWEANEKMQRELEDICADLAPAWLQVRSSLSSLHSLPLW